MPLGKLTVSNFKGIAERTTFELKPLTLFIGPNSSGKSSCIHALAALAQTIKLTGSRRSIVLDDEYAQVHLGRFIEVIHSKSYSDSIEIGIAADQLAVPRRQGTKRPMGGIGSFSATYSFKSTRRTQDVFIERAELSAGGTELSYRINPKNLDYNIRVDGKPISAKGTNAAGLRFEVTATKAAEQPTRQFYETFVMNRVLNDAVADELRQTLYLGPFRQPPQRRYPTRGASPLEVGAQGESAITLLANEYVQSKNRQHIKQVSSWMAIMGLAKTVEVSRVGKSDLFDVSVTLPDGAKLPIADLGYGISQILPVLVQCSFAEKGATLLFEQPELHLHPAAARRLATVLASVAKQKNLRVVAETHSREMFVQLLGELKAGSINLDDIAAYKVVRSRGQSVFEKIEIEIEEGQVEVYDPWDNGLCQI